MTAQFVLFDHGPDGGTQAFADPSELVVAWQPAQVPAAFEAMHIRLDADNFELVKLKLAAAQLFDAPLNGNRIEKQWWPSDIAELNPESIKKIDNGIYIKLDSFFVEESGLFIPAPGTTIDPGVHADPGYLLLGDGVYSYYVTG